MGIPFCFLDSVSSLAQRYTVLPAGCSLDTGTDGVLALITYLI